MRCSHPNPHSYPHLCYTSRLIVRELGSRHHTKSHDQGIQCGQLHKGEQASTMERLKIGDVCAKTVEGDFCS